jgi:hypothetical protein
MNPPSNPNDPLLQSLAEEAADLPLRAAHEARNTRARAIQRRRQFALTITVLFCGVCAWQVFMPNDARRDVIAVQSNPADPSSPSESPDEPTARLSLQLAPDLMPSAPAPKPTNDPKSRAPAPNPSPFEPSPLEPPNYVKVQTEEQAENNPLPPGLSAEQENLLKAARGFPLLLVRDSTGKVTRIHVIER